MSKCVVCDSTKAHPCAQCGTAACDEHSHHGLCTLFCADNLTASPEYKAAVRDTVTACVAFLHAEAMAECGEESMRIHALAIEMRHRFGEIKERVLARLRRVA